MGARQQPRYEDQIRGLQPARPPYTESSSVQPPTGAIARGSSTPIPSSLVGHRHRGKEGWGTWPPTRNNPTTRGAPPAPPSAEESRHQKDSVQVGAVKEVCAGFCVKAAGARSYFSGGSGIRKIRISPSSRVGLPVRIWCQREGTARIAFMATNRSVRAITGIVSMPPGPMSGSRYAF